MNQVRKTPARAIVRLVIAMCLLGTMPAVTARAESAHSVEASRATARRLVAGDDHACIILTGKGFCWGRPEAGIPDKIRGVAAAASAPK